VNLDSSVENADVGCWHETDMTGLVGDVRFRG
jgi:hypothetical protein